MKQKTTFKMFLALVLMAFCGNGAWAQTTKVWKKATTLAVGDKVILVCESKKMEHAGFDSEDKYGIGQTYTNSPKGVYPYEVVDGFSKGSFAFKRTVGQNTTYLYRKSGTNLSETKEALSDNSSWTVTFPGGAIANKVSDKNGDRIILYNVGAKPQRFASYYSTQDKADPVVFYKEMTVAGTAQNLSFPQAEYTVDEGTEFATPELTGAYTTVAYTSSNTKIATVDNTGKVTLVGVGTVTITAEAPAGEVNGDKYLAGSASYTLTVVQTKVRNVANIAEFLQVNDGGMYVYTFSNPVVATHQFGKDLWIQDATGGLCVHGSLTQNYTLGDQIPAGFAGKRGGYNGLDQLIPTEGFQAASGKVEVAPAEMSIANIQKTDISRYVILKNVSFENGAISDGTNKISFYNKFSVTLPTDALKYDVVALVGIYNANLQVNPISAELHQDASLKTQNLTFPQKAYVVVKTAGFVAPQVSGAMTAVTYSSSDETVATVDAATGAVTLVGLGTTTISADAAASAEYNPATASYELVVESAGETLPLIQVGGKSTLSENFAQEHLGKDYGDADAKLKFENKGGVSSLTLKLAEAPATLSYFVKWYGSGTFGQFDVETSVDGLQYSSLKKYTNDSFSVVSELNEVHIALNENVRYIRWTYTEKKSGNIGLGAIYVTKKGDATAAELKVGAENYITYYGTTALVLPEGLTAYYATVAGNTVKLEPAYQAGEVLPKKVAVLLNGAANTYQCPTTVVSGDVKNMKNDLKGALTNDVITAPANTKFYIFANDPANGLGFYYQGATGDGSSVQNLAGKAYLSVTATPDQPAAVQGYRLDGGDLTGIEAIEAANGNAAIYTLSGVRVNAEKGNLPKGLYIINGKKILVK